MKDRYEDGRVAARKLARELTKKELDLASGACASPLTGPTANGGYDTDCVL